MTGRVGVPRAGEKVCRTCDGAGQLEPYTGQYPTGYPPCDRCAGTGVVRVLRLRLSPL